MSKSINKEEVFTNVRIYIKDDVNGMYLVALVDGTLEQVLGDVRGYACLQSFKDKIKQRIHPEVWYKLRGRSVKLDVDYAEIQARVVCDDDASESGMKRKPRLERKPRVS